MMMILSVLVPTVSQHLAGGECDVFADFSTDWM